MSVYWIMHCSYCICGSLHSGHYCACITLLAPGRMSPHSPSNIPLHMLLLHLKALSPFGDDIQ